MVRGGGGGGGPDRDLRALQSLFSQVQVFTPPGILCSLYFPCSPVWFFFVVFFFLLLPSSFLLLYWKSPRFGSGLVRAGGEHFPSTQRVAVPTMGTWQIYHLLKEGGF